MFHELLTWTNVLEWKENHKIYKQQETRSEWLSEQWEMGIVLQCSFKEQKHYKRIQKCFLSDY